MEHDMSNSKTERLSFRDFLQKPFTPATHMPLVSMDLDPDNPAVKRLIRQTAKQVIEQHYDEILALKDK